ncbi:MAG: preprotein translocase [Bacteroidetes bacterium]|nr:MAG: preprotein translocase [Bacteroidota bacterium]
MRYILSLLFVSLISGNYAMANQNADSTAIKPGVIHITKDPRIDSLLNRHIRINKKKQSIPGFRIQIYFGSNRSEAHKVKADFIRKYPETKAYIIYHQPNFKIRVGDYQTRYEAEKLHKEIVSKFKSVFIVPDEISLPKL